MPKNKMPSVKVSHDEQEMDHEALELYGLDKVLRVDGRITVNICAP
jgi:hypothetical protein